MACLSSPVPFICISPAPQEDPIVEPFSPFSALAVPPCGPNGFRLSHSPPTTVTSFKRSFSPLRPVPAVRECLESQQFEVLLAASKQRNVSGGSSQSVEFRREIAIKAHNNKQSERRALFLSKLQTPPSPTAMMTPKTPPESPGIFHYSLPSPGLESPLALFESWSDSHANDVLHTWVERVDFRLVDGQPKPKLSLNRSSARGVPSLDQISARLIPHPPKLDDVKMACDALANEDLSRPSIGVGRLRMPLRTQATLQLNNQQTTPSKPISSPPSPEPGAKTFIVPRSRSSTTAQLTESNLNSLNSRDQKASNMLFTLRKRTLSSEFSSTGVQKEEVPPKLRWRRSAPADMTPLQARSGFEHPVLALSGGF